MPAPLDEANAAVVREVERTLLDPAVLARALDYALNVFAEDGSDERRDQMTIRLATLDFDGETCRLEPIENPFGAKVLPMSPE